MTGEICIPTWLIIIIIIIFILHSSGSEFLTNVRGAAADKFERAMRSQIFA